MKFESILFTGCAVFFAIVAIVYAIFSDGEAVGIAALFLSGGLCLIIGGYFTFIARRIDLRPEDRSDGEIHEGAGELGFFSPGSYWPFGIALSAMMTGFGLAFWFPWLIGVGIIAIIVSAGGLLFEYYTGQNANAH
ncbi:cytochrome c oxidase subunit IV [Antricoccus suffuscus]|uniref:Cytochrome c oxidase polypeptide 4 n=1 Tax=Antricoccus suffuscus TaxID=1629062 RepID=A0A2T0ZYE3_9ACTN|nr:cytochrome c oxidase subunit 4 [Antricoccus suffuscus]PRZ41353.1 cytochrome c oxidase subunit IV [Antricoccus suffuscus]